MTEPLNWIKKVIERATFKWPPRSAALRKASRISQLADKRTRFERQCNHCKEWFKSAQIQMDHIVPKGKYCQETFFTWLAKCFPDVDGWQVLCKPCHLKKTNQEKNDGAYK